MAGDVNAHTSGGSINVNEAAGTVNASTSGGSINVTLVEQPKGNCRFTTSGGSITVNLSGKIGVDVDASTSGGRVSTDFPVQVQGDLDKHHLRALMRSVYERRDEARAKAERAYAESVPSLTWENAAERFIALVNAQDWGDACKVRRIPCMTIQF